MLNRRSMLLIAASLNLAAVAGMVSCLPTPSDRPPKTVRRLSLVISGDTAGWIMPCGCASNQSGGLARRAGYVNNLRKASDVIIADVGGAPGGSAQYDRVKFAAILAGEHALDVVAHNLGAAELRLGPDELRRLSREKEVPFVSANAVDAAGEPLAPAVRIATSGGRHVAFVGVVSPQFATDAIRVSDPRGAVVAALDKLGEPCDAVIVLAYCPTDELEALALRLPEADLVVGGPTRQSIPPRASGPKTLVGSVTSKGKYVLRFDAPAAGGNEPWRGEIVEIEASLPEDAAQLSNLETYKQELARLDLPADETGFTASLGQRPAADYRVAGSNACRDCHQADHQVWHDSRHAAAWQTLVDVGWQVDASCQHCHTTGFGLPGGFVSAKTTAERGNVGCESCHGPSQAHAGDPRAARTPFVAREQCATCHDRENSPQFAFDAYWEQIAHGSRKGAPADSAPSTKPTTPEEPAP